MLDCAAALCCPPATFPNSDGYALLAGDRVRAQKILGDKMIARVLIGVALSSALSAGALFGLGQVAGSSIQETGNAGSSVAGTEGNGDRQTESKDAFEMGLDDWAASVQGEWSLIGEPTSTVSFEGPAYREYYDGALMLERDIRWQFGCDGVAEDMPAFVMLDVDTGTVESCTFLLDIGPDEIGFAQIGLRTLGTVTDRIYSEMSAPRGLSQWADYVQGDWVANRDVRQRLRFQGNVLREFEDGTLVRERNIEWRFGCGDDQVATPALVVIDPQTGHAESCAYVRYHGIELIGLRQSGTETEQMYTVPNSNL